VDIIKNIFISPSETRLRTPWRILAQSVLFFFLLICFLLPFLSNFGQLFTGKGLLISQVAEFFAVTLSVFGARRWIDRRSVESLGFKLDRFMLVDLLSGIGISSIMIGMIYLVEVSLGWLKFNRFVWQSDSLIQVITQVAVYLITFILVGWNEEVWVRGYLLQNLAHGINLLWAVILSSIIFGALHGVNPHANLISFFGVVFAGLFLTTGYLRTRQLWLPIGLHIGWNFFEGVVFGFPVSGTETYSLIISTVNGPDIWTGGLFGPEAGLIVIPILIVGLFLVLAYSRNRESLPLTSG
jgi:membrane protease YdiL (CAAX protease family)